MRSVLPEATVLPARHPLRVSKASSEQGRLVSVPVVDGTRPGTSGRVEGASAARAQALAAGA